MSTVWGPRVGGRVSRYIPYQTPKMELFAKITNCYFRKKLHLMFEMVLNTPLHHLKTIFQAKRKVAHTTITTKTSTMKIVFLVKVLARSENSKNHLDKK